MSVYLLKTRDMITRIGMLLLLLVAGLWHVARSIQSTDNKTINSVIGEEAFKAAFDRPPSSHDSEYTRIHTHLAYVEQLLRERGEDDAQRRRSLDLLREYRLLGQFPRNHGYPDQRRPCFIDREGRICAVGYLVEKTAGLELAQHINDRHQYDYLSDMDDSQLLAWAETTGLTLEELAMIQPTYGWWPPAPQTNPEISDGYGLSSAFVGGLNLATTGIQLSQMSRNESGKLMPILGLVGGATQLTLGIVNLQRDGEVTNDRMRSLSFLNIGLGTSSVLLSGWNLLRRPPSSRRGSIGLEGVQVGGNSGLALTYRKAF